MPDAGRFATHMDKEMDEKKQQRVAKLAYCFHVSGEARETATYGGGSWGSLIAY